MQSKYIALKAIKTISNNHNHFYKIGCDEKSE